MQNGKVVGVGGERMRDPVFGPYGRRQHRTRIDTQRLIVKQPPPPSEHRAQLAFPNGCHLADPFELILVEPLQDVGRDAGKQRYPMRREKRRLVSSGDHHRPDRCIGPPARPPARPPNPRGRLRHQLVDGRADGEGKPQPLARLPANTLGDIHQRAEQPLGAGEVEERMTVAARLDDGRVDPEDFVERARSPGIERRVGGEQDQVGAEPPGEPDQHPPPDARRLGLGRERQHGSAVGSGWGYGQRPAPEGRGCHSLDGGDKGRGVDEKDGAHRKKDSGRRIQDSGFRKKGFRIRDSGFRRKES
jgi:hypothetical protein